MVHTSLESSTTCYSAEGYYAVRYLHLLSSSDPTLIRHVTSAKFSYIMSTDIGVITNIFSQDIYIVDTELQNSWLNFTYGGYPLEAVCKFD